MISEEDDDGWGATNDEEEVVPSAPTPPPLIRGLKDILQQREERKWVYMLCILFNFPISADDATEIVE